MAYNYYLYLNNSFIENHSKLVDVVKLNFPKEGFRKELLAAFRDKVLIDWCKERNILLKFPSAYSIHEINDNDLAKRLYQLIVGEECKNDLSSDFSKLGEFLYCECMGSQYTLENGIINVVSGYRQDTEDIEVHVVFRSLMADNNVVKFSVIDEIGVCIKENFIDWKDKGKDKECSFDFSIPSSNLKKEYRVFEGDTNQLFGIKIQTNSKKKLTIEGRDCTFYYVPECDFWVFRPYKTKVDYKVVTDYIARNHKLGFSLPSEEEARKLRKIDDKYEQMWVFGSKSVRKQKTQIQCYHCNCTDKRETWLVAYFKNIDSNVLSLNSNTTKFSFYYNENKFTFYKTSRGWVSEAILSTSTKYAENYFNEIKNELKKKYRWNVSLITLDQMGCAIRELPKLILPMLSNGIFIRNPHYNRYSAFCSSYNYDSTMILRDVKNMSSITSLLDRSWVNIRDTAYKVNIVISIPLDKGVENE